MALPLAALPIISIAGGGGLGSVGSMLTGGLGSSLLSSSSSLLSGGLGSSLLSGSGSLVSSVLNSGVISSVAGTVGNAVTGLFGGGTGHIMSDRDDIILGNGSSALAVFYNHPAGQGGKVIVTEPMEIRDFNINGANWHDCVSRIDAADGVEVIFYEHGNFGGNWDGMTGGNYTTSRGGPRAGNKNSVDLYASWNYWNDRISSAKIKAPAGWTLIPRGVSQDFNPNKVNTGVPFITPSPVTSTSPVYGPTLITNPTPTPITDTNTLYGGTKPVVDITGQSVKESSTSPIMYLGLILLVLFGLKKANVLKF